MSNTFNEATQAKLSLKMTLLQYHSWFKSIAVFADGEGYSVQVAASEINDGIKKIVPQIHQDVAVTLVAAK